MVGGGTRAFLSKVYSYELQKHLSLAIITQRLSTAVLSISVTNVAISGGKVHRYFPVFRLLSLRTNNACKS